MDAAKELVLNLFAPQWSSNAADDIRQQPVCGAAAQQHRGDLGHKVIGHGGDPKHR